MIAAVLETFRNDNAAANHALRARDTASERFEPVSRILERCDEKSLKIARPFETVGANS